MANDTNPEALWVEVYNYNDASGERAYGVLALFTHLLLTLPLSNADDDGVFSQIDIVKLKIRNRMNNSTLSGILNSLWHEMTLNLKMSCTKFWEFIWLKPAHISHQLTHRTLISLLSKNIHNNQEDKTQFISHVPCYVLL